MVSPWSIFYPVIGAPTQQLKDGTHFLDISKISRIIWTPNPLDRLVLKPSIKDVVAAFAKNHFENLQILDNPTISKGQGLVLLLTGPPGTGKTMIAEATAEEAKLPLYRIHAGELGSHPSTIEIRLREILELATDWRAIVLLDEADAFISVRERMDRTAGEIVSIFLRQLEYFKGMLCLTSNIPYEIDPALKSRCRLNIHFENLTAESRREVWKLNLGMRGILNGVTTEGTSTSVRIEMTVGDWERLTSWNLNGREIHNVVENTILWGIYSNALVDLAIIEDFISLTVPDARRYSARRDRSTYNEVARAHLLGEGIDDIAREQRAHVDVDDNGEETMEHEERLRGKRRRLSSSA
ncbi:MAG: hypothetical protein Q9227_000727 [Pyrenula ochraceoflavens]